MDWTNEITNQFANANINCPVKTLDMSEYAKDTSAISVLAVKLKTQFLSKHVKDPFMAYLCAKVSPSIDWMQLATRWIEQVKIKNNSQDQLQLL